MSLYDNEKANRTEVQRVVKDGIKRRGETSFREGFSSDISDGG